MLREILKHPVALIIAIALHVLIVMIFIISFNWSEPPVIQEMGIPIELIQKLPTLTNSQPEKLNPTITHNKVIKSIEKTIQTTNKQNATQPVVDNSVKILATKKALTISKEKQEASIKKRKEKKEAQAKKRRAEEKKKKEAKEKKIAEAKAKKEAKEKKIREASLKKWQKKKQLEKEQRLAAEKRRKEQEEKKKQAAILAKEAAMREKIAAEKQRTSQAAKQKAKSDWGEKIKTHVRRRWQLPPATRGRGMSAQIRIRVSPSGYIRGPIEIVSCNGHPSYCASVKQAYKDSEPLPRPSRQDLDRTFLITMDDE